jgi:osmotically-inducible protein OsmY
MRLPAIEDAIHGIGRWQVVSPIGKGLRRIFMLRFRKWVLTLGVAAAAPGIASAGPLGFFTPGSGASARPAGGNEAEFQKTADEIATALRGANLRGHDIDISFSDGVAVLTGSAADARQKALITRLTSQVPGVQKVDNQLAVSQGPAPRGNIVPASASSPAGRPSLETVFPGAKAGPSNQEIANQISKSLTSAKLQGRDVTVQYQNGLATINGTVADRQQWMIAGRIAAQVPGVQGVNNQLRLEGQPGPQGPITQAGYQPNPAAPNGPPMGPPMGPPLGAPPAMSGPPGMGPSPVSGPGPGPEGSQMLYNLPNVPEYAWPTYASYPNYAQVAYPSQYSASAWPYIGPFYPYPQVPLGWRKVQLEWDDGYWSLNFNPRTDRWWWFFNPMNWQ